MANTTFNNFTTPAIDAGWLNDVNNLVYNLAGTGPSAPTSDSDARDNLGITAAITAAPGRLLNVQRFLVSGTYTPTSGTTRVIVEMVGGGGAGGGAPVTIAGQQSAGGGGGSGAYTKAYVTGVGATAVTVGAGGTGVLGGNGNNGGTSSFGASITAPGGVGGPSIVAQANPIISGSGGGAPAGIGGNIIQLPGRTAPPVYIPVAPAAGMALGFPGADSVFGDGATVQGAGLTGSVAAANTGGGGGGTGANAATGALTGGAGGSGMVVVYEYS